MLQRAASNAYSWWWASHIRTKQSKWLSNNLHEMDDRVKKMLTLIDQDADSFAKRAEIYFQKRPELIIYVEETYREYRALAERYAHISGELHKANHTISTAFPEEVEYAMLEEEEEEDINFPKAITPIGVGKFIKPAVDALVNKTREDYLSESKKGTISQITKENAQEETIKLQKGILALQTEKEFIKSSYEKLVAKYWEIDREMMEMQEVVFHLEEKYDATAVIEDDEARSLMTATVLKSCEDAMSRLEEQRIKSMEQAKIESERIKSVQKKMKVLKGDNNQNDMEVTELSNESAEMISIADKAKEQAYSLNKERLELQSVCEKVKEHFPDTSPEEIAEKIDELVNKFIALELTVSTQSTQINRLNLENNNLENYLHALEEEKTVLINGSNKLTDKLMEAEDEFRRVQTIEKTVQDEELIFQRNITDFSRSLSGISERLQSPKNKEIDSILNLMVEEDDSTFATAFQRETEDIEVTKEHYTNEDLVEDIHVTHEVRDGVEDNSESTAHFHDVEEENEFNEKGSFLAANYNNSRYDRETSFGKVDVVEEIYASHLLGDGLDHSEYPATDSHFQGNSAAIQDPKEEKEIKDKDSLYAGSTFDKEKLFENINVNQDGQEDNSESKADFQVQNKSTNFENLEEENEKKNKDSLENEQDSPFDKEEILKLHQLLLNSLEGRERILLSQYASLLRKYKEAMKSLSQEEKLKEDYLHEKTAVIRELKIANAMKDEEIRFLRQVLESSKINLIYNPFVEVNDILQSNSPHGKFSHDSNAQYPGMSGLSNLAPTSNINKSNCGSDVVSFLRKDIDAQVKNDRNSISSIEQKIRKDINTDLDENLNFWLRFSASLHHVLEFQTTYEDVGADIVKLHGSMVQEGNGSGSSQITKLESDTISARLRTLKTELHVWLEQSSILRGELESKFSSLCSIQEEIMEALTAKSQEELVHLTPYQATKLQGEVLNMQQENNNVASELQVGQNHVRELQAEVEKELSRLEENLETYTPKSSNHDSFSHSSSPRRRVPLSAFLFSTKPKKPSIFARINPVFHKQYNQLRSKTNKR